MSNITRIWIDESLKKSLENFRLELAIEVKKIFNLKEVTISDNFTSQVLASKIDNKKFLNFKIKKKTLTSGTIEFVG